MTGMGMFLGGDYNPRPRPRAHTIAIIAAIVLTVVLTVAVEWLLADPNVLP